MNYDRIIMQIIEVSWLQANESEMAIDFWGRK